MLGIIYIFLAVYGGVPYYHQDQEAVVGTALQTIQQKGYTHFFLYPSLIIYINTICYALLFCLLYLFGMVHTASDFALLYGSGRLPLFHTSFLGLGHLITVAFGLIGMVSTYLMTHKLTANKAISFIAAFLLITSLLWISNSHFATVDIPLASLLSLFALLVLHVGEKGMVPQKKEVMILGIVLGLIASTKYNGAIVILPLVLSLIFVYRHCLRRMVSHIALLGGTSLLVFLLTNPFTLVDFNQFIRTFLFQISVGKIGFYGYTTMNGFVYHITHTLPVGYGTISLLLGLLGIVWLVRSNAKIGTKIFFISSLVSFYFSVALTKASFQRYMLPLAPILAVFSGLGVFCVVIYVREMKSKTLSYIGRTIVFLGLGIVAIQNISSAIKHDSVLSRTDTREEFLNVWNKAKVNKDAAIFLGHSLQPLLKRRTWVLHNTSEVLIPEDLGQSPWDIIIFDSFSHDRILYEENIQYWKELFLRDPRPLKVPGANQWNSPFLIRPYLNYENLHVLQISPFTIQKEKIPFSPQSAYSPYLPDLWYRTYPGSFIEIYTAEDDVFAALVKACQDCKVSWNEKRGIEGYYFNHLSERYRD